MAEWILVTLSFCLGARLPLAGRHLGSLALASGAIVLLASSAFVLSGEFHVSWTYYLLDFLQTALGFLAGNAALRAIRHTRNMRKAN